LLVVLSNCTKERALRIGDEERRRELVVVAVAHRDHARIVTVFSDRDQRDGADAAGVAARRLTLGLSPPNALLVGYDMSTALNLGRVPIGALDDGSGAMYLRSSIVFGNVLPRGVEQHRLILGARQDPLRSFGRAGPGRLVQRHHEIGLRIRIIMRVPARGRAW